MSAEVERRSEAFRADFTPGEPEACALASPVSSVDWPRALRSCGSAGLARLRRSGVFSDAFAASRPSVDFISRAASLLALDGVSPKVHCLAQAASMCSSTAS
eukprot:scaffold1159_cov215-Pinguiococcus_pyrenoidosus.AAC.13